MRKIETNLARAISPPANEPIDHRGVANLLRKPDPPRAAKIAPKQVARRAHKAITKIGHMAPGNLARSLPEPIDHKGVAKPARKEGAMPSLS